MIVPQEIVTPTYQANWHTHTFRCKHALGDAVEYAAGAVVGGLKTLGFSEHMPTPDDELWIAVRLYHAEVAAYRESVRLAAAHYPELNIYCGMECEYLPDYPDYFEEELLGRYEQDYLVLGLHSYPYRGEWVSCYSHEMVNEAALLRAYADYAIEAIHASAKQCRFMAHPDLFGSFYAVWDADTEAISRDIIQAARDAGLPLEINAYGLRKPQRDSPQGKRPMYPWRKFWELAGSEGAVAIVNSDAHRPQHIVAKVDEGIAIARKYGLKLITPLDLEPASWQPA